MAGQHPKIVVLDELRDYLPSLNGKERTELERNILDHGGLTEPITLWYRSDDEAVVVDGHNRFEICQEHGIDFETRSAPEEVRCLDSAKRWMDRNQLGRRNVTPEWVRILIGRIYGQEKQSHGGDRKSEESSGQNDHLKTAKEVAEQCGVSEKTVRRAESRAKLHDSLLEAGEKEAAEAVRRAPQATVDKLATVPTDVAAKKLTSPEADDEPISEDDPYLDDADQLRRYEGKVSVCVESIGASAASLIAMAGDENTEDAEKALQAASQHNLYIEAALSHLTASKKQFRHLQRTNYANHVETVDETFRQLTYELGLLKAEGLCPSCDGSGCTLCEGAGFVLKYNRDDVDKTVAMG